MREFFLNSLKQPESYQWQYSKKVPKLKSEIIGHIAVVRGKASQWITSYLHNRMQFVSIDGTDSKTRHMQYGVPQGSILGPLLFIIYIKTTFPMFHKSRNSYYMLMTQISLLRGIILLKSMRSYVICVKFSSNGLTQMATALTLRKLNI